MKSFRFPATWGRAFNMLGHGLLYAFALALCFMFWPVGLLVAGWYIFYLFAVDSEDGRYEYTLEDDGE